MSVERWRMGLVALSFAMMASCGKKPSTGATARPDAGSTASPEVSAAVESAPATPVPADTLIQLERTACFGDCPRYLVSIQGDGTVVFQDRGRARGCGTAKAGREAVARLVGLIRSSAYFELKSSYSGPARDQPSTLTSVTLDGRTHGVSHSGADRFVTTGPEVDERKRLSRIEEEIDMVAGSSGWLKAEGLPTSIPFRDDQLKTVADAQAKALARTCLGSKDPRQLELSFWILAEHRVPHGGGPWRASRAVRCAVLGEVSEWRCFCDEVEKWSFPAGCGATQTTLRFDFGSEPPKVEVARPDSGQ